jgi:Spy/CpxP family protein refolding chaperone
MRHKIAISTMGFMIFLAAAIVTKAQDAPPPPPGAEPGMHMQQGGPHGWGDGPRGFEHDGGEGFGHHEGRGFGGGEHGGMHGGFGGGEHLIQMAENPHVRMFLGLTDDQVQRLHQIGVDSEKASIQNRADMELKHLELRELLRSDNPDHDAIMSKLDEVNATRGKIEKQRVETFLNARGVLTPEQLKKVKEFMEHRGPGGMEHGREMEHHGGGRPPMHGGGPGGQPQPKPAAPPAQ